VDELVEQGEFIERDDGYEIPAYLNWNHSREWWQNQRAVTAPRVRPHRNEQLAKALK